MSKRDHIRDSSVVYDGSWKWSLRVLTPISKLRKTVEKRGHVQFYDLLETVRAFVLTSVTNQYLKRKLR